MVIISQNDHTQKKAMLLQDMHYRNISQRLMLLKRFVNIIITSFYDIFFVEPRKLPSILRPPSCRPPMVTLKSSL